MGIVAAARTFSAPKLDEMDMVINVTVYCWDSSSGVEILMIGWGDTGIRAVSSQSL